MKKSLWLHNIRSVHNVGSMFRTADAAGITHIYLSGYTPLPIDRFGRERKDMHKVAIGAEKRIAWTQLKDVQTEIAMLKEKGVAFVGVEQDVRSVSIFDFEIPKTKEVVVVMGEETLGMEQWQVDICDSLVEIPMHGSKESLNVSVAFGIAVYQLFK